MRTDDRRDQPISAPQSMPLLPARVWSEQNWTRIQAGYLAQDMDEKWNVHADGDTVYLHRSWTGYRIYQAAFAPVASGWHISHALVEADPERHRRSSDEFDCLMLEVVLSAIVLGEPAVELRAGLVELTRQASGRTDLPAGLVQHSALGLRTEPTTNSEG